jgi:hypothetical protein
VQSSGLVQHKFFNDVLKLKQGRTDLIEIQRDEVLMSRCVPTDSPIRPEFGQGTDDSV